MQWRLPRLQRKLYLHTLNGAGRTTQQPGHRHSLLWQPAPEMASGLLLEPMSPCSPLTQWQQVVWQGRTAEGVASDLCSGLRDPAPLRGTLPTCEALRQPWGGGPWEGIEACRQQPAGKPPGKRVLQPQESLQMTQPPKRRWASTARPRDPKFLIHRSGENRSHCHSKSLTLGVTGYAADQQTDSTQKGTLVCGTITVVCNIHGGWRTGLWQEP